MNIFKTISRLKLVFPLGSGFLWKIKLVGFIMVLFLKRRLHIESRPEYRFRLSKRGKRFRCYLSDEYDLQTLSTVFSKDEYDIKSLNKPSVILDLGANIGLSSIYFSLKYPQATIYSFEPNPLVFERLKRNTFSFSKIKLFEYAVSDSDGTATLYINPSKSVSGSFVSRPSNRGVFLVHTRTLVSIRNELNLQQIDILKFDVEGAEEKIFSDPRALECVNTVVGEVHPNLMNIGRHNFLAYFRKYTTLIEEKVGDRFILKANL